MRALIYKSRRGLLGRTQYRARIVAQNGKTTFVSAESYNNVADLEAALRKLNPDLIVVRKF
jgi:uncharacterized protein YegP (UPF0339 family)